MKHDRAGTLVVLACHCVYDPQSDAIYTDQPAFVNDRPVYEAQLDYALRHLRLCRNWDVNSRPLLVISGGISKAQRRCSESRSYIEMANRLGLGLPEEQVALEEFALTSTLTAISAWTPLGQSWPSLEYFPVGDLRSGERQGVLETIEKSYIDSLDNGLEAYYDNEQTKTVIARRDVFLSRDQARKRYGKYPLPF
jgi:hypothetical protein